MISRQLYELVTHGRIIFFFFGTPFLCGSASFLALYRGSANFFHASVGPTCATGGLWNVNRRLNIIAVLLKDNSDLLFILTSCKSSRCVITQRKDVIRKHN